MIQTIDEIAEILKALKLDTEINSEEIGKILASINSKLDSIADDYAANSLLKDYIVDLKQTLDTRYGYSVDKYNEFENAFKYISKVQESAIKSSDFDDLLQKINSNIETIKNSYLDKSSENVQTLSEKIGNLNSSLDKVNDELSEKISHDFDSTRNLISTISREISTQNENLINENQLLEEEYSRQIKSINDDIRTLGENLVHNSDNYREMLELKTSDIKDFMNSNTEVLASAHVSLENILAEKLSALENLNHGFETNIVDVNNNLESLIQNLNAIDPAGQNDLISHKLENILLVSNDMLSSLQICDKKYNELIEMISELAACKNLDTIQHKLEDITVQIAALETSVNEIRFDNNFMDFSDKINAISCVIDYIKNMVAELHKNDNLESNFNELNEKLSNIVTENDFNDFRSNLADFIQQITDNSNFLNNNIVENKENLEKIIQLIQSAEVNEIIIQDVANKVSEIFTKINTQYSTDTTNIMETISSINSKVEGASAVNEKISQSLLNIVEKFSGLHKNAVQNLNILRDLHANIAALAKKSEFNTDTVQNEINNIKSMIAEQHQYMDDSIKNISNNILNNNHTIDFTDVTAGIGEVNEKLDTTALNLQCKSDENTEKITSTLDGINTKIAAFSKELSESIAEKNSDLMDMNESLRDFITEIIKSTLEEIKNILSSNINVNSEFVDEKAILKEIDEKIEQLSSNWTGVFANITPDITNALHTSIGLAIDELKDYLDIPALLSDKINDICAKTYEISGKLNNSYPPDINITEVLYSINDKVDASSVVNEKISHSLLSIAEKFNGLHQNAEQSTNILRGLQNKISSISDKGADNIQDEIKNIKSMLSSQRQYLENTEISDRTIAMADCLQELDKKIDDIAENTVGTIDLAANTNDIKASLTEAMANVFTQISFIEEAEDLKGFVEEKTDEISKNISDLQYNLRQIACNSNDETYNYSLQDVESDIAKLRLILNKISASAPNEELNRLSDNVSQVENTLSALHNTLMQNDIAGLKDDLRRVNDDIISISSRTNKLLLNSDNSYKSWNDGINAFKNMVNNLSKKIDNLNAAEVQKRIEQKITSLNNAVIASADSNKVIREVLMYLGEWMDTTTENINSLCETTSEINNVREEITSVNSAVEELKNIVPEKSDLLTTLEDKFEEQQERIAGLETKLEKVLKVLDTTSDTKLNKKVDKIEKLINKLSVNVDKLASYVDEE